MTVVLTHGYIFYLSIGGAAGSVLANRLTEVPNSQVLLVEAGSRCVNLSHDANAGPRAPLMFKPHMIEPEIRPQKLNFDKRDALGFSSDQYLEFIVTLRI